jgi:hypothetical protein
MKYCAWCSKKLTAKATRVDLCLLCNKGYDLKKKYRDLERFEFPHDDPCDDEYKALVHMNTNQLCQNVMSERIRRKTAEIQDGWTDKQRARRAVYKKKDTYVLLRFKSLLSQRGVLYRSI